MIQNRIAIAGGLFLFFAESAYAVEQTRTFSGGEPRTMFLLGAVLIALACVKSKRGDP